MPVEKNTCDNCNTIGEKPLKRCSSCHLKSYCSKECQVADWKAHRSTCRQNRAQAGVLGWEHAAMQFNNDYGAYAGTYAIGAVFNMSTLDRLHIPSLDDWRKVWLKHACAVELLIVPEVDSRGNTTYKTKFLCAYPVKVEDYLLQRRLRNYRKSIETLDWSVGMLLMAVLEPNGPIVSIVTAIRPLAADDVCPPGLFIANMGNVMRLLKALAA